MGSVVVGSARACTYGIMPENGWGSSVGAHLGKQLSGDAPTVRFGIYETSSGNPTNRMAYTNVESIGVLMASGSGGDAFTALLDEVNPDFGPSDDGVMLWSGNRYAIAVLPSVDPINHGMIGAGSITETYESFFYRTGLGGTPPDPYGTTSSSIEGWMSQWINYDPNVAPDTPTGLSPTGTVSSTTPTFTADFTDDNSNRGDVIKQYQLQLRPDGGGTNKWDTTYSASNSEQNSDSITRAYGGTSLTPGSTYEWRIRMSDQFGAWSAWSAWTDFTVSGGGTVVLDGTPTGVQQAITGLVFQGRWNHVSALSMDKVKVRLLQNGVVIGTSGEISKSVASSAAPGTLFSVNQSDSSIFNAITWGQSYQYQMQGRATNAVWSDWSNARSFSINSQPNTPHSLSPTSNAVVTDYPLLTFTMTDPDDTVATGLTAFAMIIAIPVVDNPSFADGDASSWGITNKHANATVTSNDVTYQSTTVYDGDGDAGQVAITASTVPTATLVLTILHDTFIPVEALTDYDFQMAVRTTNANLKPLPTIYWYDASQVFLSSSTNTAPTYVADTWYSQYWAATAPASARYMRVGAAVTSASANQTGTIFVDDLDYFDSLLRIRQFTQSSGSTTRWEYQTVADDIPWFGTYQWQAYGNDGSVGSENSAIASFVYAAGPVVTITAPTASQVLATSTPTITWTVIDQQKYQVDIYDDDGVTLLYTSGEVVSTTNEHLMPPGYLLNGFSVIAYVTVWNSSDVSGTSSGRSFSIDYDEVTPVLGVEISTVTLRFDRQPSAILLSWEETGYDPSTFEHYNIYRRTSTQTEAERILLRKITSPSQTTFLDMNPASRTEYVYSISQTILFGTEELESATTDAATTIVLPHTIIAAADAADDYRIVIKYWTERGWEDNTDGQEILPWGASKPTVLFGSVYYRTPRITARFVDDDEGSILDYQSAINDLLARRSIVCFRDPKGRRIFGVIKKTGHEDTSMGTVLDVEFELTETNYTESQA